MLKSDEREQIEYHARLDERDEITSYLRQVALHIRASAGQYRWFRRTGILAGAAAIEMAADTVGKRHRKADID